MTTAQETYQERTARIEASGGLAFPRPADDFGGGSSREDGMTLRDWFAGKALAGYLAAFGGDGVQLPTFKEAAREAYGYADAMLAARKGS